MQDAKIDKDQIYTELMSAFDICKYRMSSER